MTQPKFEVGEIVQLLSGGPKMTVDANSDYDGRVYCTWFSGTKQQRESFAEDTLAVTPLADDKSK